MNRNKETIYQLAQLSKYQMRFDQEKNPSAFYSLIEWYAKVMFPNFQETGRRARAISRTAHKIAKACNEEEVEAAKLVVHRAFQLTTELDKLHEDMVAREEQLQSIQSYSWCISDKLERLNSDLLSVLLDLDSIVDE